MRFLIFFFQKFFSFQNQGFAPHISAFPLPPSPVSHRAKKLPPVKNKRAFRLIQMNVRENKKQAFSKTKNKGKEKQRAKARQTTKGTKKELALYYNIYILLLL